LRREGITAISVDEGIRILRQAVCQSKDASRVVVAGRFGNPPTIQFADSDLPLLRFVECPRVHMPGVELVVDSKLSMQTDPYLGDHVYQGTALLPAVIGLEAMVQAATAAIHRECCELADGPLTFENVELLHPVVVREEGETQIRIAALARDRDTVDVVLRSDETSFRQDHFRARIGFGRRPSRLLTTHATSETNGLFSMDASRLYGEILFHRGRFQRVQRYLQLSATQCVADVDPYAGEDWFGTYLPAKMILGDPASRDAIIHCIQACIPHGTLLPIAVERLVIWPRELREIRVHAKERLREGDEFVYDVDVMQSGEIVEQWRGLRLRKVSHVEPSAGWPWQLLVPYLERRIGEQFPDSPVSIRISDSGCAGPRASDPLIAAAAGVDSTVHRRPDGKPEIGSGQSVSATHCGELIMAVAADGEVACDVELVRDKRPDQWRDLLGQQLFELANLISRSTAEDVQTSATRVWCAAECLTKVGLSARDPLTLDDAGSDGWVTLRSGSRRIASWVWPADGSRMRQVFAILVSPAEKVITCDLLNTNT
jgi:enediyne polyketide synthase